MREIHTGQRKTRAQSRLRMQMAGGRFAVALAGFVPLAALVIASVAFADPGESERAAQASPLSWLTKRVNRPVWIWGPPQPIPTPRSNFPMTNWAEAKPRSS